MNTEDKNYFQEQINKLVGEIIRLENKIRHLELELYEIKQFQINQLKQETAKLIL